MRERERKRKKETINFDKRVIESKMVPGRRKTERRGKNKRMRKREKKRKRR